MNHVPKFAVLVLAVSAVSPAVFAGSTLTIGGPGVFGTPYATLGLDSSNSWEVYRKYNSWGNPALGNITAAPVTGNNTQASFDKQFFGGGGGGNTLAGANGQIFMANTNATTPTSNLFYLKDMLVSPVPAGAPVSQTDVNGHTSFDIRVGFVQSGSAYVTARGGDNHDTDLFGGGRGTNTVYMHVAANNASATVANPAGNAWSVSYNGGTYLAGATPAGTGTDQENLLTPSAPTQKLISSGTAPTLNPDGLANGGSVYSGPLEISSKMYADTVTTGNVVLQVKMGNNIFKSSFNPNDATFGAGGFQWSTAKPIIFVGKAAWNDYNTGETVSGVTTTNVAAHLGTLAPGDANADGKVNAADTNALLANFGGTDKTWSQGDFTQDGRVNAADTNVLLANFGKSIGAVTAGTSGMVAPTSGPAVGKVDLVVDTITGDVKLVGGVGASTNNYEIDSASGALNPAAWNKHTGWVTALSTSTGISEFTFGASQDLNNAVYDLGNIFKVGGAHDLTITGLIYDANFNDVSGQVTYLVPEPVSLGFFGLGVVGLLVRRRQA